MCKVGGHGNNFRLPSPGWACSPSSGTAPVLMLVGLFFLLFLRPNSYSNRSPSGVQFGLDHFLIFSELKIMPLAKLDFIFPFIVFFYGVLVVFVTEVGLTKIILNKSLNLPSAVLQKNFNERLEAHKPLAWVCFWVGGLWSLQNLFFI